MYKIGMPVNSHLNFPSDVPIHSANVRNIVESGTVNTSQDHSDS